ncbi:elongation factor tu GTP binding domain-containing protein [Ditylenchus destructor]|nr:elongation factor tu GTP binding domain-containing protein [Ditylenchus destructor]
MQGERRGRRRSRAASRQRCKHRNRDGFRINDDSSNSRNTMQGFDGAKLILLNETTFTRSTGPSCEETKIFKEVLVQKLPDNRKLIDLRLAILGSAEAGKSTLCGVLTQGTLDNGQGKTRLNLFRFRHEFRSGKTSSICLDFVGFSSEGELINYKDHTLEEVIERSSRLITLIDLAGDRKYLKTTIYGVSGYQPHYCVLIINAKTGATAVTREHLGLAIALDIPVFAIITKVDLVDDKQHERVLRSVENLISTLGRKIVAKRILCRDDIISCADSMPNREILPIFSVSSVTGLNLDLLTPFLNLLPQTSPAIFKQCQITANNSPLFYVDEIFQSEKVGTVVCGILSEGIIHQGQSIQIGPDKEGCYAKGVVESIHRNKQPVPKICAETPMAVSFRISFISPMKDSLKRGMVLISSEGSAVCCRRFVARFCLLNHPSREICIGFQGTVYIGSLCRTVSVVNFDSPSIQPCEWLDVEFEFWQQAEFLRTGMPLIFRERRTKGMGEVIRIHPLESS